MRKLQEVLSLMNEEKIGAIIVSDPYNIRYFSGFTGGEGYYYISPVRQCLLTDSRYTLWAENECGESNVITIIDGYYDVINQLLIEDEIYTVAFEGSHVSYSLFNQMMNELNCDEVVALENQLTDLRMVKDNDEIELIAGAESIGDEAFDYILGMLKPGMTEKECALEIEMYMRKHGADALSFDVIAASGINSASPHAVPTDKPLEMGDFLTMDFGCIYKGYCSDMTRTVVIGKANLRQKELYQVVLDAQQKALDNIYAGMTGAEADSFARDVITEAGYGNNFGHGLGHSVGLYIHEEPRLSVREDRILVPGMVVTVEPGIYVPGFGGVRIEDVIVIGMSDVRNLTKSPKQLIEV